MTGPSFSVVIPAYNARRTIERAIQSILKQTVSDLEVLVIENASTDGTHEIVETIDDPRVILVRKEEKGLAAARNTGIQRARND
jgi:glycosyltransferase involved in cell wall biosynthesis